MVSAEIAVAICVPIENHADCEVRVVIRFLQADEILGYLDEEASSRVELFCYTTMDARKLPGRHKPCCVSNYIATSSSNLLRANTLPRSYRNACGEYNHDYHVLLTVYSLLGLQYLYSERLGSISIYYWQLKLTDMPSGRIECLFG